jgi:hypothetical protein
MRRGGFPRMRIAENDQARLVLRDSSLWISWICFAAAVALAVNFATRPADPRLLVPPVLLAVFGVGFFRSSDLTFDKMTRTCVLRRRDLARVRRTAFPFGEITDVRVEIRLGGDRARILMCRLNLIKGSETLPLTASYAPGLARYEALRETLADVVFAGRTRPPAADPLQELADPGRVIDTISFMRSRDGLDLAAAHARIEALRAARPR